MSAPLLQPRIHLSQRRQYLDSEAGVATGVRRTPSAVCKPPSGARSSLLERRSEEEDGWQRRQCVSGGVRRCISAFPAVSGSGSALRVFLLAMMCLGGVCELYAVWARFNRFGTVCRYVNANEIPVHNGLGRCGALRWARGTAS